MLKNKLKKTKVLILKTYHLLIILMLLLLFMLLMLFASIVLTGEKKMYATLLLYISTCESDFTLVAEIGQVGIL